MGWLIFSAIAWSLVLFLVPFENLNRLWRAGVVGLVSLYIIDSTLIKLGAFYYSMGEPSLSGLSGVPTLYLVSGFAGAILLAYYYPSERKWQLPYVLFASASFLALELIMVRSDYIQYKNWSLIRSYFLDVFGLTVVLWASQWLGAVGKDQFKIQ